ncbi:MAG: hypothetical protein IKB82_07430, partial [Clostridia bacterium]|nr:hypothetical protein [Clostridia bacterium]
EFRPMQPAATTASANSAENAGKGARSRNHAAGGCITCRSCEGTHMQVALTHDLEETGRVLDVTLTLKNVCPCRSVSVGCQVYELDEQNNEHSRGIKTFTVQPHYNPRACDIELDAVRFVLPDDARVSSGARRFIVRSDVHYAGDYTNLNR